MSAVAQAVDVGAVEDFEEGRMRIVPFASGAIGVVRWRGRIYAVRNVCPHQQAPLCAGRVRPGVSAGDRVGDLELDRDRPVITCPWHGWEFDLQTGESPSGREHRVKTYDVAVEDGRVLVLRGSARG